MSRAPSFLTLFLFLVVGSLMSNLPLTTQALAGVDVWTSSGPVGGTVYAVLVHPQDSNLIFAGTMETLWRTSDGGANWSVIDELPKPQGVWDIAVDPKSPNTIYAAAGWRLFKSTDRGVTWNSFTVSAECIDINPATPSTLYVGHRSSSQGISKSTDGGQTWTKINSGLTAARATEIYDLAVDPSNPSTLYAATGAFVCKSTDAGANWVTASTGLPNMTPTISTLAIDPGHSSTLYAGIHGGGVAKSTNGGSNWTVINTGVTELGCDALAVDPANSSVVYLGNQHGVSKSTDGGAHWTASGTGMPTNDIYDLRFDPANSATLHAATSTGVFKSTNRAGSWNDNGLKAARVKALAAGGQSPTVIYAAIYYGGVSKSTDQGASWQPVNTGLTERAVYTQNSNVSALAVHPTDGNRVYLGINHHISGGVFRSTNGGASWAQANTGLTDKRIKALLVNPKTPTMVFAGTSSGGVFRSTNGGDGWTAVNNGLTGTEVNALAFDPNAANTVYAAISGRGVFKSTNAGDNWTASAGSPTGVKMLVSDPARSGVLYAASGNLHRTIDGGASWKVVFSGSMGVEAMTLDPLRPATLYLLDFSGKAFRSHNRGGSWEALPGGVPIPRINAMIAGLGRPGTVWAALEGGSVQELTQSSMRSLWFPFYQGDATTLTGYAVSNYSTTNADLTLTAYGTDGNPLGLAGNPSSPDVAPRSQLAQFGGELFLAGPQQVQSGWIKLTSTNPDIGSFFQVVGTDQMDGSVAFEAGARTLYFTRVFEGPMAYRGQPATTILSIANISDEAVDVELRLNGKQFKTKTHNLPARGLLYGTLTQLFGAAVNSDSGWVTAHASGGAPLIGFELIRLNSQTIIGLNAQTGNPEKTLYSAQLASMPGLFTGIKLVNTFWDTRNITLYAVNEQGQNLAPPVSLSLEWEASVEQDAAQLFGLAAGAVAVGSLRIECDGDGVIGDVVFGDSLTFRYAAALPLQTSLFTEAVFSQVANGFGLFTGIALHNPGQDAADVTLEVWSMDGVRTGITSLPIRLNGGARLSKTLDELLPATAGQIRGYILVRSTQPLIAQQLFGSSGLTLMSAVSPAIIE